MTSPGAGSPASGAAVSTLGLGGWQAVLAAEHAAIYGYSVVGVHLSDSAQIAAARTLQEAHRDTRDALMSQIAAAGADPTPGKTLYAPAQPVVDATSAQRWAAQLENACAVGYRYVLTLTAAGAGAGGASAATQPPSADVNQVRSQALTGLTSAAVAASSWQVLLTPNTPTVPFPGAG